VQDLAFSEVNRDTMEVLRAAGCEVVTPPVQPCCGSLHAHNGELELARALARRQLDLFDLKDDPHEQHNLASDSPELVETGKRLLREWKATMQAATGQTVDPLETTLAEGGSLHARQGLDADYPARLRATGRGGIADRLEAKYANLPTTTDL